MKRFEPILLLTCLTALTLSSCKKVRVGGDPVKGRSGAASASQGPSADDPSTQESQALLATSAKAGEEALAAEDELGGEAIPEGEAPAEEEGGEEATGEEGGEEALTDDGQTLKERFNLVKWARTRPKLESMYKYFDEANTLMKVGDKKKFGIETNGTFGVSPDFDSGEAEERKIGGKFWLKAFAFDRQLRNQMEDETATGLFIDVGSDAVLDKINMEMWFRYVGVDIATRSIMAGFDQIITREKSIEASVIPLVKGSISVGGEMGFRTEFGIRRDGVVNMIYTPHAQLRAAASIMAGVVIVETGIVGQINLVDLRLKGSANLGYMREHKLLYFDIGLDPGQLRLIEGKLEYVPVKTIGIELLPRITIYKPDPFKVLPLPGFTATHIKFFKKPPDANACRTVSEAAAIKLAGNIKKLQEYVALAPDTDKPMMMFAIGRAGLVHRKVKEYCGGY